MLTLLKDNHRLVFYGLWLIINFIQAASTELIDDEAYYWVYSRFLDWGYFDHPPLVAFFIKAGYYILPGEAGVRLFFVLLNTATVFIIQQLTEKKNDALFYAIAASVVVAQLAGIIAAPDIPLLFFTALFFWLYQRFVSNMSIINSVLLGCCAAFLLYSKYHGVLIILFTLASNPGLFTRYQTYLAGSIMLLLFVPHLYWQYQHGFPSIQYHLFERSAGQYSILFSIEYIAGQFGIAGPIAGWLLLWSAFIFKPTSTTQRALKFSLIGIYSFFLLSSLKGRVEANWTVAALIPLMALSHQYLPGKPRLKTWLFKSIPITLLLVTIARIYLMINNPPAVGLGRDEYHQNKVWTDSIQQKAAHLPVAFINSYQQASKYWFYKHTPAFSMNTAYYRRNNFNYWPLEDSFIGKPVYIPVPKANAFLKNLFLSNGLNYPPSHIARHFFSFSKVTFTKIKKSVAVPGCITLHFMANVPAHYLLWFKQPCYAHTPVWLVLYEDKVVKRLINTAFTVQQLTATSQSHTITIPEKLQAGNYTARLCIGSCVEGFPTINSGDFRFCIN